MSEKLIERFENAYGRHKVWGHPDKTKSSRPDINAFILLNEMFPGTTKMVSGAEHDVIFLDVDSDELCEIATDEQIEELSSCGVFYDPSYQCVCMFV